MNLRFHLLDLFITALLVLLSYLVPKNKEQILLGSRFGLDFVGNPKYFYLYLLTNQHNRSFKKIFWITKNREIYFQLKTKLMPVIYSYSFAGFVAILRSNFLIDSYDVSDIAYLHFLPGRFNKIEIYHGLPFKGLTPGLKDAWPRPIGFYLYHKERASYRGYVVTSEETKRISEGWYHKNIVILGYPRNDIFFNHSFAFEDYKNKFNLSRFTKVILYCPTFRDKRPSKVPFTINFLKKLNDYLIKNNYTLLLKNHPNERSDFNVENYSNIIDVSSRVNDVQDLLIHVDVLITDYSSVVMDFILSNKPIIFYPYDYDEYTKIRKWDIDYYSIVPGPFAKNEEELLECLKSIETIFRGTAYKEKYEELRNKYHFYKDGKSCERLYNFLRGKNLMC